MNTTFSLDFATEAEGSTILGARDRFVAAHSPLDRQARLGIFDRNITEAEVLAHCSRQVVAWSDSEKTRIKPILERLQNRIKFLHLVLPLPPKVLLIKTTGAEEFDAAYTRQHGILLPAPVLRRMNDEQLEILVVHELFHVMTRHQPLLRQKLYALIGFQICPDVLPHLPPDFHQARISNPDMPSYDAYTELSHQGKKQSFVMSLRVDPGAKGHHLLESLQVRLLQVENKHGKMLPMLLNDQPLTYPVSDFPELNQQMGRDTDYHIQPEESLAAYFELLYQPPATLKDPQIVQQMRDLLRR